MTVDTFRQRETEFVMGCWRASDSCSLVGIGSIGKSNLLQHLADAKVQAQYLRGGKENKLFRAIIVNPQMLSTVIAANTSDVLRCWAGYELMMHELYEAFYPFEFLSATEISDINDSYRAVRDTRNPLYAHNSLRHLEFVLSVVMQHGAQIVFMFDEFEEMLRSLPLRFFLTLRGLRDMHKFQLSYFTFTRAPIKDLVREFEIDSLLLEPFLEIFQETTFYVGMYAEADARAMVAELLRRADKSYSAELINFLLWATGHHAGLLRAGTKLLEAFKTADFSRPRKTYEELLNQLVAKDSIRSECATILNSLSRQERSVLSSLLSTTPQIDLTSAVAQETIDMLLQKQLLVDFNNQMMLNPPLIHRYLSIFNE
jgi:hypothetical protein